MTAAFITGSHAYGDPTEDSDIDLVILATCTDDALLLMQELGYHGERPLRDLRLNLILCEDEIDWAVWRLGTYVLKRRRQREGRPIHKDEATELFDKLRRNVGREPMVDSGDVFERVQEERRVAKSQKTSGNYEGYTDNDIPF